MIQRFISVGIVAIINSGFGILISISFALLIFSGEFSPHIGAGIGIALFSAAISRSLFAQFSRIPGLIADTDALPSAIIATVAAAIAPAMADTATPGALFATLVAFIAVSSLFTGGVVLLLGYLQIGGLIRFIPYPVVGGFIAGTGWLLLEGAFKVMIGQTLTLAALPVLWQPLALVQWAPALGFALLLLWGSRQVTHPLFLPIGLLLGGILFYLALIVSHTSLARAAELHLVIGAFPETVRWPPLPLQDMAQINWEVVASHFGQCLLLAGISAILILFNASGLEQLIDRDIDLDHELRVTGWINIVSGLGGGMVGYHGLGDTTLAYQLGARNRWNGLITGGICAAVLVSGADVLAYLPVPLLGAALLFLSLSLLIEWLVDRRLELPKLEYGLVVVIVLGVAFAGLLEGLMMGLIAAIALFIIRYSRQSVIAHELSRKTFPSRLTRPRHQQETLQTQGDQIGILMLQGFLFFGSANQVLNHVRQRLANPDVAPWRFLILDFRQVTGLDASALYSFQKLYKTAQQAQCQVLLAALSPAIAADFERHQLTVDIFVVPVRANEKPAKGLDAFMRKDVPAAPALPEKRPPFIVSPNLDRALQWCEEGILAQVWRRTTRLPVALHLSTLLNDDTAAATFLTYLDRRPLAVSTPLFAEGEAANTLYFIESGTVSTYQGDLEALPTVDGQPVWLASWGASTLVGEVDFLTQSHYTVSARVTQTGVAFCLTREQLMAMEMSDPAVALAFVKYLSSHLAQRLNQSLVEVNALLG